MPGGERIDATPKKGSGLRRGKPACAEKLRQGLWLVSGRGLLACDLEFQGRASGS